jgi:hypothetical protein
MRNGTQVGQAKAFLLPLCCAHTQRSLRRSALTNQRLP